MSRYHKAAIDGNLDILKEATKNDLNIRDGDGMTPTILAAFHGHVDALQLICSRGGDPNKSDIWGNTPLHHAAGNGHMQILSFLVNFGGNLFALDNDFHTAMDVAASRDRMDCVRFLDAAASQQTSQNTKGVAQLKMDARNNAEKRVKHCEKVKKRHQSKMDKMYSGTASGRPASDADTASGMSTTSTTSSSDKRFSSLSAAHMIGSLKGSVMGTLQKRFGKTDKGTQQSTGGDGNGNVIFGMKKGGTKPEFVEVFDEQDENAQEGDDMDSFSDDDDGDDLSKPTQSIFNRPGLGGLRFMKNMGLESEDITSGGVETLGYLVQNESDGDEFDLEDGGAELPWNEEELGLDDEGDEETSPLDTFLSVISLQDFAMAFRREKLDLEALMLCSDEDLKGIRIQLGPRKKILEAASRRKSALESPCTIKDSHL